MTIAELYRYPTRHFDFHEQQLTLGDSETIECEAPYLCGGILSLPAADLWTSSIAHLAAATSNTRRGFELTRLVDEVLSAKNFRPTCHFRCMRVGHSIMAEASIVQWT